MHATKTILVVDDDPDVHQLIAAALPSETYQIDDAYGGMQALSYLEKQQCDLVLTDIRMPGMDGLELLRRIRQTRPDARVLVMTAENTPENITGSLRDQAIGFFSKPFSLDYVAEAVAHALEMTALPEDIEVISALPNWISLQVRCKLPVADRLVSFLREMCTE